jgi:CelD/BcsL family acetyltransferase involved in cellulose biosynthesis
MSDAPAELDALAPEWDELVGRAHGSPFVRPGWIRAWWRSYGRGELRVLSARRGSRLAGVLPVELRSGRVEAPTNLESPDFAVVAEDADVAADLARDALALGGATVLLSPLAVDGDDLPALRAAASKLRHRTLERVRERSPYIALDGTFDDYAHNRAKLFRDINRRRRRLAEEGTVEVQLSDGTTGLEDLLGEGLRLEGSGWKSAQSTDILSRPEARRLYVEMTSWAAARGILRLAFLRVDGRPVAFQLGLEEGGAYFFCKGGYDPDYHRFAPGKLLLRELVERAFGLGLETFEFLGADEPWKLEWTEKRRERRLFLAFPPTLVGRLAFAAEAYGRPAARKLGVRRLLGR